VGVASVVAGCISRPSVDERGIPSRSEESIGQASEAVTTFTHPGVYNTKATLDFVKGKIAAGANPWKTAYNAALSDTYGSLSYPDHPPTNTGGLVTCGSHSSPDIHCHDQRYDAVAAYTDALIWYFSGNQAYANLSMKIMNDWCGSLTGITDSNMVVQAGWVGGTFAAAAEIIRYTNAGWSSANATACENMFKNVFVPLMCPSGVSTCTSTNGAAGKNGNWATAVANSLISIGVYTNDTATFNAGVALWNDRAPTYSYMTSDGSHPKMPTGGYNSGSGYCSPSSSTCDTYGYWGQAGRTLVNGISQETCRDFEHAQMGLDGLFLAAQTADIQGQSLYAGQATRLQAAMEWMAGILVSAGVDTSASTYQTSNSWLCSSGKVTLTTSSITNPLPAWEVAYNQLVNVHGLSLPNTLSLLNANRDGAWHYDNVDQAAWQTLTHAGVGAGACTPTTCSAQGKNCGSISNGCGGTLGCGSCTSPAVCGGAGVANVCGTSCTPTTCSAQGKNCGSISDGCGGTLSCGSCTTTQVCSTSNTCVADTVAPSVPSKLTDTNVTTSSVTIDWLPSTDNVSVAGYKVYRGGTQVGTSSSTSYTDTGLATNTSYSYTVSAYDPAGNTSAQSTPLSVGTSSTTEGPYLGTPAAIPGIIHGENYDVGGENVGYYDTTAGNSGGQYRSDDVDIELNGDTGGGYNIGWTVQGEYLNYTVNVAASAPYLMALRIASTYSGQTMHVEVDGVQLGSTVAIPNTGAWQTYQTVSQLVTLTAGQHVLKVSFDTGGVDLNFLQFTAWSNQDIGPVGVTGSWSQSNGTYTVNGSGADIGLNASYVACGTGMHDEFQFVYQTVTGDATITARAASIQNVNGWSKDMLMMRDGLADNSSLAAMAVSADAANGYYWFDRTSAGGSLANAHSSSGASPIWLRITRRGNVFTGYYSTNGTTWTQLSTTTITMSSTLEVGLGVTSRVNSTLATGTFDNVSVTTP
jgi:chitodextrinase